MSTVRHIPPAPTTVFARTLVGALLLLSVVVNGRPAAAQGRPQAVPTFVNALPPPAASASLPADAWNTILAAVEQDEDGPLTCDTIEEGKLAADDPANMDGFGWSVSVSGSTAVVGAPTRNEAGFQFGGAAYVFDRSQGGENRWCQVVKLSAPDTGSNHQFGRSVSISGDTLIVGAVGDQRLGAFTGSAYIFERNQGGPNAWGLVAKLTPSGAARGDVFGEGVAISGDIAVVGAPQNQAPFPLRPGFIAIYARNQFGANAWGEVARRTASDGMSADRFGASVSISGDRILVGAPGDDNPSLPFGGGLDAGSAYIFSRDRTGPGTWGEAEKLTASDGFFADVFGSAVSISGNDAIIGAPGASPAPQLPSSGVAYVFARDPAADAWTQIVKLTPGAGADEQSFAASVAISGDAALVGSPDDSDRGGAGSRSGSAHLFLRRPDTNVWRLAVTKVVANDARINDQFGSSIALDGDMAIAGAPPLGANPGAAYACQITALSIAVGACRRAIPIVNSLITMSNQTTTCCEGSEFAITATFTNTSALPIGDPFFEVTELVGGNLLQNADGGPGGVGATLTPDVGDGVLSPGESMVVTFVIRLQTTNTFWFYVNVRGEPVPQEEESGE